METANKLVALPITVPKGKYCWVFSGEAIYGHCEHFDNEGGHSTCELRCFSLINDDYGVLKNEKCLNLKDI